MKTNRVCYTVRVPEKLYRKVQAHIRKRRKAEGLSQMTLSVNSIIVDLLEQQYGKP